VQACLLFPFMAGSDSSGYNLDNALDTNEFTACRKPRTGRKLNGASGWQSTLVGTNGACSCP